MPRRRPAQVRALQERRGPYEEAKSVAGLTADDVAEVRRLERTRGYLWPGAVAEALAVWRGFVHTPHHRLWLSPYQGCGIWQCCGDPHEARQMLEYTLRAMSRRHGRHLRRLVASLDELY